jgi:predicted acetyltransferase
MPFELRPISQDEFPAYDVLESEAFGGGERPAATTQDAAPAPRGPAIGIFDGTRLVAGATVYALHLFWGAQDDVPMGGVAGVACAAEQRGRGHVGRLLGAALAGMREDGQYLSALFPFAYAFYRRHGWDWVGERRTVTVPTAEIPSAPEGRCLRTYDGPEATDVVRPIYEAFARSGGRRSMATRRDPSPPFWEDALKHRDGRTTYVQVYHDPATGGAQGYLTFRFAKRDGEPGQVGEIFAISPPAYRGLLSVLHYYGTQMRNVRMRVPASDPLPLHVMHHGIESKVEPAFMGRIVDVAAALRALRPDVEISGRAVIRVADTTCDWNDRAFLVEVDEGRVSIGMAAGREPGVTLDIQTLTQAYWGQPDLPLLRAAGRFTVAAENDYALLAQLLPPAECYFADFF